jgi:iron complex outermembrane receptor protein
MMKTKSVLLSLLVIFIHLPSSAFADTLTGRVLDPQGGVVSNAQVRLFDRKNGQLRTTTANSEGTYSFNAIPAGDYLVESDASSAALSGSKRVSVRGDQTADIELKISSTNVEVLVTAAGAAQSIEEVAKAIDVVDSEQIAQRDEFSVTEAIRTLPGIRVQQLEGPGSYTTVKTRGLPDAATAILIDGMRFRDASSIQGDATAFLGDLTVVDTERIEFLRGSGSALYGSHALGGVINVSSRPGGGNTHGDFRAEGGGLGMIRSVASVGGGFAADRFTYSGAVALTNVTKGPRDYQPYRSTSPQGNVRYNFTPKISLTGRLWYSDGYLASSESSTFTRAMVANQSGIIPAVPLPMDQLELLERKQPFNAGSATFIPNQIDPDSRRLSEFVNAATSFQHSISPSTFYRINYQRAETKRTFIDGPAGPGSFDFGNSRSTFGGYIDTFQAHLDQRAGSNNQISVGYEFERDRYSASSTTLRQRTNAVYAQDQIRLIDGRLQVTLAARAQTFSLKPPQFSSGSAGAYAGASTIDPPTAYTGDGSIAYFFRQAGTKLRAHVGNSFRTPAGYERFGGDGRTNYGDPRLSPERALAVDAGIDQWLFTSKVQLGPRLIFIQSYRSRSCSEMFLWMIHSAGRMEATATAAPESLAEWN